MILKNKKGEEFNDLMLDRFLFDEELHKEALNHCAEKGYKGGELEPFTTIDPWLIIGKLIAEGKYAVDVTEIHYLDKESGLPLSYKEFVARDGKGVREIYVMSKVDRVVMYAIYKIVYDRFAGELIHKNNKSYKKGSSTITTARELIVELERELETHNSYVGYKEDLTKYFDSVPIHIIDGMLDVMEGREPSCIWKVLRRFYHDDRVRINGELVERYGSLKQGCAFGCFLANIVLNDVDREMEGYEVIYKRYSDDLIIVGKDAVKARERLLEMLGEKDLTINPKKTEKLRSGFWFTFLGYRFNGGKVSISKKTLRKILLKVEEETLTKSAKIKRPFTKRELEVAIDRIQRYLFFGCEKYPEGGMSQYLYSVPISDEDLRLVDEYIKDCLRAAYLNRTRDKKGVGIHRPGISDRGVHGLLRRENSDVVGANKCIAREIPRECGWYSLIHMKKKFHCGREVYEMEKLKMKNGVIVEFEEGEEGEENKNPSQITSREEVVNTASSN